jgi:hypothetical protein
MQVTAIEAAAIERFVLHVTVPIFLEVGDSGGLLATGTLFKIGGRVFLITARHVFDDLPDLTRLAYPEDPIRGGLYTLGSFTVLKPTAEHVDVAAVELKSPETVQRLEANWQFLSLDNVAAPSLVTGDGAFFVSGYPGSLTKTEAGWTTGKLATAYTQRLPYPPAEAALPVVPELDLFFEYGHDATSVTGAPVKTPELPGVSGASVWELRTVNGVWTPEAATRVVGIQSAYRHTKYFRAKSWWAVAKVLEQVDQALADAVRAKLNEI